MVVSLFLYSMTSTLTFAVDLLIGLAIAGVISAAIFVIVRQTVNHTHLSDSLKHAIIIVVREPIPAVLVGSVIIEITTLNSTLLPSILKAPEVALITELAVLAVTIRATSDIAKHLMFHVTKLKEGERVLVYGIYALGIIALAFVLLTSPASPIVLTSIWSVVGFVTGLIITYLVVYVASMVFKRYSTAFSGREPQLRTTVTFLRRVILGIIALVGVAATTFSSFPQAGATVASLFVAAGFASIVIGLAAQSALSNIFAGVIVATFQPFRIGDALSYANEWAWVEDIKLTFTILRTWDNRRLVVPNQMFLSSTMINYDLVDSSKLCVVYVSITYDSDLDKAIEILKDITRKHPDFLPAGNLPVVHVMDLGDANSSSGDANATPGILLRVLGRAKDQPTNFQMSKDILYAVKKAFDANGIELAYPKRQIVIDQGPNNSPFIQQIETNTQEKDRGSEKQK